MKESITLNEAVDFLNGLLLIDRAMVTSLCFSRVPCNKAIEEHPNLQVHANGDGTCSIGLIGFLNGLFEVISIEKGGAITAILDDKDGSITNFAIAKEPVL